MAARLEEGGTFRLPPTVLTVNARASAAITTPAIVRTSAPPDDQREPERTSSSASDRHRDRDAVASFVDRHELGSPGPERLIARADGRNRAPRATSPGGTNGACGLAAVRQPKRLDGRAWSATDDRLVFTGRACSMVQAIHWICDARRRDVIRRVLSRDWASPRRRGVSSPAARFAC